MAKVTEDQVKQALASVAQENGGPKVIFRYGFKIVEFNGEQVIEALTREEYIEMREREEGHPVSVEAGRPHCVYSMYQGCLAYEGCRKCEPHNDGSGWYCSCVSY